VNAALSPELTTDEIFALLRRAAQEEQLKGKPDPPTGTGTTVTVNAAQQVASILGAAQQVARTLCAAQEAIQATTALADFSEPPILKVARGPIEQLTQPTRTLARLADPPFLRLARMMSAWRCQAPVTARPRACTWSKRPTRHRSRVRRSSAARPSADDPHHQVTRLTSRVLRSARRGRW
jgi:hypothetical protein